MIRALPCWPGFLIPLRVWDGSALGPLEPGWRCIRLTPWVARRPLNPCRLTTPVKPRLHGHNASVWRDDAIKVNGWDERMQYGGQDLELGERLENLGVRGKTIRYSAICVHLEHKRGYMKPEMREKNDRIREETRGKKLAYTPHGIDKHLDERNVAD